MIKFRLFTIGLFAFVTSLGATAQEADFTTDTVCLGEHTTLYGQSSLPDIQINGWYWDMDNDGQYDDAFGKYVTHIFTEADTFPVGVKVIAVDLTEYIMDEYKTVVVYPVPDVNFHVDNLCEGLEASYIDQSYISSGTLTQFHWDFNNDGNVDNIDGPSVKYVCGPSQVYVTKLTVYSDRGCSAFTTKTTEVFPTPDAAFSATNACMGNDVTFSDNTSIQNDSIVVYQWDFDDGTGDIMNQPTHAYQESGSFDISLIVISANNCKDTATGNVTIYPLPDITLSYYPDSVIAEGESVTITANGNYSSAVWSDGTSGGTLQVDNPGTYTVTVTDADGCASDKSAVILQGNPDESDQLEVASNILTPNGDGINEYMEIRNLSKYNNVRIVIYNRWGDEVLNSTSYNNDWNGAELDPGAYFYIITADNEEIKGNINILK
ncbi:MAG: gliding motility-associated C-terminal domain-containing protein [Bacteroidetes bacterium]|nr:gliding motility-associated C-terminal domain-containing protein [Bacteroidota bacterium]